MRGGFLPFVRTLPTSVEIDLCFETYEYHDHYLIAPGIKFSSRSNDFTVNAIGEKGHKVPQGFEYNSLNNHHYMSIEDIKMFNLQALL